MSLFAELGRYFVIAALLGFGITSAFGINGMKWLFGYTGYYFIALVFLIWILSIFRLLKTEKFSPLKFWKKYRVGLLLAIALTTAVFISVPPRFRILSDETNLLGVSQSMLSDRSTGNPLSGHWVANRFEYFEQELPLRPLGFPFLVSLIHTLFGFRYQNIFALNFLLLIVLLSWAYIVSRQFLEEKGSCAAMFFLLSCPLVSLTASSGGYDLCACVFLLLAFTLLFRFMKKPTAERLGALWMTALFLSHIRYESALFFPVILGGLWFYGYVRWKDMSPWIPLTLLSWMPVYWQRFLMRNRFENPPGVPAFSLSFWAKHLVTFFRAQFDFRFYLPFPAALFVMSWALLFFILWAYSRKKVAIRQKFISHFVILLATLLFLLLSVYLAHHAGIADEPMQARLFLLFAILLSLVPVLAMILFPRAIPTSIFLIVAVGFFVLYHPVAMENEFMSSLIRPSEVQDTLEFIREKASGNFLFVTDWSPSLAAMRFSAMPFRYANTHVAEVLDDFGKHLYQEIYVAQVISNTTHEPVQPNEFDNRLLVKPEAEFPLPTGISLRISKVIRSPNGR